MSRLLLIRHGQSEWNALRRWQGWADPPLTAEGEREARQAGPALRVHELGSIVSSDLQRARRTAELLAEGLGLPGPAVDADLKERDVGDWSGLTADEIDQRWPGLLHAWRTGKVPNPPNGETNDAFVTRLRRGLASTVARCEAPVLVVTHGGVIRVLEREAGVESHAVPNLGGRWFQPREGELTAGEIVAPPVVVPDVDDERDEATIL
jgi:broad specificity phosphatase PhoE